MKYVKIIDIKALIISILIPLAVGGLSAGLSGNNAEKYALLPKPPLSPPSQVFPIVWTVLYILMGISSYLIWENYKETDKGKNALIIYGMQLLLNFSWSIAFFGFGKIFAALIILCLLIIFVLLMILSFGNLVPTAAALQIPYLIWCIFAGYLNLSFWLSSNSANHLINL